VAASARDRKGKRSRPHTQKSKKSACGGVAIKGCKLHTRKEGQNKPKPHPQHPEAPRPARLPRSTGKPEEGRAEDEPQVPCGLDQQALPPLLPLPMQRPSCIKPDSDKWHGVTPQCLSVQ